jgi:hypothetical protein
MRLHPALSCSACASGSVTGQHQTSYTCIRRGKAPGAPRNRPRPQAVAQEREMTCKGEVARQRLEEIAHAHAEQKRVDLVFGPQVLMTRTLERTGLEVPEVAQIQVDEPALC